MRKAAFLVTFLCIFVVRASSAEEAPDAKPYWNAQRMLAVNRSLLSHAEAEYDHLSAEETSQPSDETAQHLSDLRYKIQALKEDAVRLRGQLPQYAGADEFLKDLEARKRMTGQATRTVDETRDKKVEENVRSVIALHEKALDFVAEKRYEKAAKLYEEIILVSPDDDEAYLLLGHCRLLNTEYDKARTAFQNAVHIDPANAREITRLYDNIVLENPRDDEAYAHLGFADWILGNKTEAQQAFESALQINPANTEARAGLAGLSAERQ